MVAAVGYADGPGHCLFVPRVGTFRFGRSEGVITLAPVPSVADELVDDAYHRIALPLALQFTGREVLHASAVHTPAGVVALCGRAGAGKSTLAFALGRRGHRAYADDAVAFEVTDTRAVVRPLPFRMRLRPASAAWFDAPAHLKGGERATTWRRGEPAPLRALFVLEQAASGPPGTLDVERLSPADAFSAVLPHGYYVVLDDPEVTGRMVTAYLRLADRLPVFSLRYSPTLEAVESIVTEIEKQLAAL
jgi:hypothetical protein